MIYCITIMLINRLFFFLASDNLEVYDDFDRMSNTMVKHDLPW